MITLRRFASSFRNFITWQRSVFTLVETACSTWNLVGVVYFASGEKSCRKWFPTPYPVTDDKGLNLHEAEQTRVLISAGHLLYRNDPGQPAVTDGRWCKAKTNIRNKEVVQWFGLNLQIFSLHPPPSTITSTFTPAHGEDPTLYTVQTVKPQGNELFVRSV